MCTGLEQRLFVLSDAAVAAAIVDAVAPSDADARARAHASKVISGMQLSLCVARATIGKNIPAQGPLAATFMVLVIVLSGTVCRLATGNPFAVEFYGSLCRGLAISGTILPCFAVCMFWYVATFFHVMCPPSLTHQQLRQHLLFHSPRRMHPND